MQLFQSLTALAPLHAFSGQLSKRLKYLFYLCIVISLTIHIILLISVISINPTTTSGAAINYIDIKDIAVPSRHFISGIKPYVKPTEQQETAQKPPVDTNNTVRSNNQDSTTKAAANDLKSPLGLGMANGYFSSLADGRTLRDDIRGYYFDIMEKINLRWWQTAGTIKEVAQQDGIIEIQIGRDGKLFDVRLMRGTGSSVADRAIINAITEAAPFPALPTSYELETFRAPLKISKPSHLFSGKDL
ncbi:MAG: hypothetical protein A2X79_05190 [Desulfuromonadaceae bacterium GWB2_53_15]|nr:MAG: hypothetical protein A2X79_05190 [Desulfuromonadaceae bacterium GWB2_53_15]